MSFEKIEKGERVVSVVVRTSAAVAVAEASGSRKGRMASPLSTK